MENMHFVGVEYNESTGKTVISEISMMKNEPNKNCQFCNRRVGIEKYAFLFPSKGEAEDFKNKVENEDLFPNTAEFEEIFCKPCNL